MSKYWSEITRKIEPYVPGEQPKDRKYIKLNTNENPYPPSPRVIEAIKRAAGENLNLYPDPDCSELKRVIADYYGLDEEQVFIGNGSDELLAFSFMAFFNPGSPVLFPDITYSFYPVYADLFNIEYRLIPLEEDFSIPVEKFFAANGGIILNNGGIIIPNPNAPTSKYVPVEDIDRILKHNTESVVIIDEAYIDFGGESAVKLINNYPNLLVVQTLSKSRSLAGMRLGFALGDRTLTEGLNRIKNSFNSYTIDRLALAGAVEAFRDDAYFKETGLKIKNTRVKVSAELVKLGFEVADSKANFIFVSHPDIPAAKLFGALREKGILVRYFNKPRIDNHLRISIGTDEDMERFLEATRAIMATLKAK